MIIKFYEINKINLIINNLILLHGKNEGLKNETIIEFISKSKDNKIFKYDEKEILESNNNFYDNISNGSLFDNNKLIIINRATDKLLPILETFYEKNISDVIIIVNADILDKKSKLRTLFEKNKKLISVAFYPWTCWYVISKYIQNLSIHFYFVLLQSNILLDSYFLSK